MIARIEGKLIALDSTTALVQVGPVVYEVMLASYTLASMSGKIGTEIVLNTLEYFEGTMGGGNLIPRMIGFSTALEKDFFNKFTTVKGMGIKKGLKALCLPIADIAAAIENGDEKFLLALPSVGKRMSQVLVAELQGKLLDFAAAAETVSTEKRKFNDAQTEALEILITWGEKRADALDLLSEVLERHPDIDTAEELVPLVYRMKQGMEV
jgi:Holliday junction DNA helicase RuvA